VTVHNTVRTSFAVHKVALALDFDDVVMDRPNW
jgi:hypothetical protein